MPHAVASDLGLHCLLSPFCPKSLYIWYPSYQKLWLKRNHVSGSTTTCMHYNHFLTKTALFTCESKVVLVTVVPGFENISEKFIKFTINLSPKQSYHLLYSYKYHYIAIHIQWLNLCGKSQGYLLILQVYSNTFKPYSYMTLLLMMS